MSRAERIDARLRRPRGPLALLLAILAAAGCASAGGAPESSTEPVRVTYGDLAPAPEETTPQPVGELVEEPLEAIEPPADAAIGGVAPDTVDADAAARLAASLDAYESAEVFWQEGSVEDAIAALDRAYELMSGVVPDGDPSIAQDQESLRRLISRRIVEIYAGRHSSAGEMDRSIPRDLNDYVEREIRSFQTAERQEFLGAYARSGRYRAMIVEHLRERGMPESLSWLPVVESWFKVRAFSSARALGMWQFIASTGYRFGLQRTYWFDERMDPEKSSAAAAAYLTELHELFGDWLTALAAYNCGEARVLGVIKDQRVGYFDRFWDLYERLPRETRRFVPRFLAVVAIVEDPQRFGFDDLPEPLPPLEYDTVEIDRPVRLGDLEKALGLTGGELAALNPELRRGATPEQAYALKVPAGRAPAVVASLAELPSYAAPAVETSIHRVRPGETLSAIADRYRTSVAGLMRLNGLSNPNRIWPGQSLRVEGGAGASPLSPGESVTYTVRGGDNLWSIARRYGTSVDRLRSDNRLRSNTLYPGQRLVIGGGSGDTYMVRPGDTLGAIANRNRVSVRRLAEVNGLSLRSTIYPGQRLVIPR